MFYWMLIPHKKEETNAHLHISTTLWLITTLINYDIAFLGVNTEETSEAGTSG